jgi:hypothetical protein
MPWNRYENGFAKQSGPFPDLTWRVLECPVMGSESGKRKTTALRHLRHSKHLAAGVQFSPCSPPHVPP